MAYTLSDTSDALGRAGIPCYLRTEPAALAASPLSPMPGNAAPVPVLHMPASPGHAAHASTPADAAGVKAVDGREMLCCWFDMH
jgi:hypothetical protein